MLLNLPGLSPALAHGRGHESLQQGWGQEPTFTQLSWVSARNGSGCPPGITQSTPGPGADPAHPHLFPVCLAKGFLKGCASPRPCLMQAPAVGSILRPSHGIWKGEEGQGLGVLLLWLVLWQAGPCRCEFFPEAGSGTQLPPRSQRTVGRAAGQCDFCHTARWVEPGPQQGSW